MTDTKAKQFERWFRVAVSAALLLAVPALAYDSATDYTHEQQLGKEDAPRSFVGATSDAWITAKVKMRLIFEPGIAPLTMNVDTRDGIVTLFGSISTEDGKRAAGAEAMKVAGVKNVQNELQVVDHHRESGR